MNSNYINVPVVLVTQCLTGLLMHQVGQHSVERVGDAAPPAGQPLASIVAPVPVLAWGLAATAAAGAAGIALPVGHAARRFAGRPLARRLARRRYRQLRTLVEHARQQALAGRPHLAATIAAREQCAALKAISSEAVRVAVAKMVDEAVMVYAQGLHDGVNRAAAGRVRVLDAILAETGSDPHEGICLLESARVHWASGRPSPSTRSVS